MAKGLIVKICLPGGNIGYSFIKDHENWVVKTHLLVKGKWQTSKDVYTKTSIDGYTHKRKKENKRNIVASDTPFSLKEEIKKLEDNSIIFYTRNNVPKDIIKYCLFKYF